MPRKPKPTKLISTVLSLVPVYTETAKVSSCKVDDIWQYKIYGAGVEGDTVAILRGDDVMVLELETMQWHLWFSKKDVKSAVKLRSEEPEYGNCLIRVTVQQGKAEPVVHTLHPLKAATVAEVLI